MVMHVINAINVINDITHKNTQTDQSKSAFDGDQYPVLLLRVAVFLIPFGTKK